MVQLRLLPRNVVGVMVSLPVLLPGLVPLLGTVRYPSQNLLKYHQTAVDVRDTNGAVQSNCFIPLVIYRFQWSPFLKYYHGYSNRTRPMNDGSRWQRIL